MSSSHRSGSDYAIVALFGKKWDSTTVVERSDWSAQCIGLVLMFLLR